MPTPVSEALAMLARRPYTGREVAERLKKKGRTAAEVEEALAALSRMGVLDDLEAARATVRHRRRVPRGRRAVAHELYRRGVPPAAVEEALADYDELELAVALAGRERERGRLFAQAARSLSQRAFPPSVTAAALERVYGRAPDIGSSAADGP